MLWTWRSFILNSTLREVRSRHMRSLLGWAWLLLPPLVLVAIYAVVFSRLMRGGGLPDHGPYTYTVYLCAGVLPWQWFHELILRANGLFVQHAQVLKKTAVPWPALLAVEALVASFGLALQLFLLAGLLLIAGITPSPGAVLAWLPALAVQGLLALAIGVYLSVFHVFFRDVGIALPLALQVWFWLTPLVYPVSVLPQFMQAWVIWNPAALLAQSAQAALVPGLATPSMQSIALVGCAAFLLLMTAVRLVQRNLSQMRDEL